MEKHMLLVINMSSEASVLKQLLQSTLCELQVESMKSIYKCLSHFQTFTNIPFLCVCSRVGHSLSSDFYYKENICKSLSSVDTYTGSADIM